MDNPQITWYIVFTSKEVNAHWVRRFLKTPLHHCYCFREIKPFIIKTEASSANIDTTVYDTSYNVEDMARIRSAEKDTVVLEYKTDLDFSNKINHIGNIWPSCVSITKMCIGFTSFSYTPYALYKKLLAHGAKIIN